MALQALQDAVRAGYVDVARALVEEDPALATTAYDEHFHTAVTDARSEEMLRMLAACGVDLCTPNRRYGPPVLAACRRGDIGAVRFLASLGALAGVTVDRVGLVAAAAVSGCVPLLALLVEEHGLKAVGRDRQGETPLLYACTVKGNGPAVRWLLAHGAGNLTSMVHPNTRALNEAVKTGDSDLVQCLLDAGADPNRTHKHIPVLARATTRAVVRALCGAGACTEPTEESTVPPLHHAASVGCVDTVRALLECGADCAHAPTVTKWFFGGSRPVSRGTALTAALDSHAPGTVGVLEALAEYGALQRIPRAEAIVSEHAHGGAEVLARMQRAAAMHLSGEALSE